MDGRHAAGGRKTILQAKHYSKSALSSLLRSMRVSKPVIDHLAPSRYLLATSRPITAKNKSAIAKIVGSALRSEDDIFGPDDLNGLLRRFPDVERAHVKLWLSSAAVLDRVVHAARAGYSTISAQEIREKVRVYAENPSFSEAHAKLEKYHVLIVTGPPGVGKSTLANMLAYAYLAEDWEFVALRSLDDGFSSIIDTKKQLFLFDDFLGKVSLDHASLSASDNEFARFVARVRKSPNARFVLTTRTYLFEEARRLSEALSDRRLDVEKYALDVGIYTRRTRARILYNHLLVAGTPMTHVGSLIESGAIPKIVDHKNYNPRIIEWMTEAFRLEDMLSTDYPRMFLSALQNPDRLWQNAFGALQPRCQHLLYALYFGSQYGVEVDALERAFDKVHAALSAHYRISTGPTDYQEALRVLEGGFVAISDKTVRTVNPSLRDFLSQYLKAPKLLDDLAACAPTVAWARAVWMQGKGADSARNSVFAQHFLESAEYLVSLSSSPDLYAHELIKFWLDLWKASGIDRYAGVAMTFAASPSARTTSWTARWLVELIVELRTSEEYVDLPLKPEIVASLEHTLMRVITGGIPWDDLDALADEIEAHDGELDEAVATTLYDTIAREVEGIDRYTYGAESEQEANEDIKVVRKWAPRAGVPEADVARALDYIERRKIDIVEETDESSSPSVPKSSAAADETFDDLQLRNLFETLLTKK